jgi:hypothetical protein
LDGDNASMEWFATIHSLMTRLRAQMFDALDAQKLAHKIDKSLDVVIDKRLIGVSEADLVDGDDVMVLRKRLDYTTPVEQCLTAYASAR